MILLRRPLLVSAVAGVLLATGCTAILGIDDLPSVDAGTSSAHDASVDVGTDDGGSGGESSTDAGDAATSGDAAALAEGGSDGSASLVMFDDLYPADAGGGALFGTSLAFSADGQWLAIGASGTPAAVYLYAYDQTHATWLPSAVFTETQFSVSAGANDNFGTAVAFSATGLGEPLTLAMSAPLRAMYGAVYRAQMSASSGSFAPLDAIAYPLADSGARGFGTALSYADMNGDDVLLASAPVSQGAPGILFSYVPGENDAGVAPVAAGDQANDEFGASLAVADNHTSFVVGQPGFGTGDTLAMGEVFLGDLSTGVTRYVSSQAYVSGERFGSAVALSPEVDGGHVLFVGQPGIDGNAASALVDAYDFEATLASGVSSVATMAAPEGSLAFGAAVAASATTVAVGAPGLSAFMVTGSVYLSPLPTGADAAPQMLSATPIGAPSTLQDRALFGSALAFGVPPAGSTVASVLAVGAPGQDVGHVYLYR